MISKTDYSHRHLCEIGAKWLKNHKNMHFKCQYVLIEFVSASNESPDIYGYLGGSRTILIEVKVSRSDFLRDSKKRHRINGDGIGNKRYYLTPKGLLSVNDISNDWGLLSCDENGIITVEKESIYFEKRDFEKEMTLMYSVIRRLVKAPSILDFRAKNNEQ